MKFSIVLLALLSLFVLSGCDSRESMRNRFGYHGTKILVDEQGQRYIVKHVGGDNYDVEPIQ